MSSTARPPYEELATFLTLVQQYNSTVRLLVTRFSPTLTRAPRRLRRDT